MKSNGFAGASLRGSAGKLLLVLGLLLVSAPSGLASQATARCANLEQQLAVAVKAHPGSKATKAATLGAQADKLCTHGQPALGLRTYIRAFRALGVEPKLPQE